MEQSAQRGKCPIVQSSGRLIKRTARMGGKFFRPILASHEGSHCPKLPLRSSWYMVPGRMRQAGIKSSGYCRLRACPSSLRSFPDLNRGGCRCNNLRHGGRRRSYCSRRSQLGRNGCYRSGRESKSVSTRLPGVLCARRRRIRKWLDRSPSYTSSTFDGRHQQRGIRLPNGRWLREQCRARSSCAECESHDRDTRTARGKGLRADCEGGSLEKQTLLVYSIGERSRGQPFVAVGRCQADGCEGDDSSIRTHVAAIPCERCLEDYFGSCCSRRRKNNKLMPTCIYE